MRLEGIKGVVVAKFTLDESDVPLSADGDNRLAIERAIAMLSSAIDPRLVGHAVVNVAGNCLELGFAMRPDGGFARSGGTKAQSPGARDQT